LNSSTQGGSPHESRRPSRHHGNGVRNGKFASGGLIHFYNFAVRARAGFLASRFTDKRRLPALADGFWVAFFRGGRIEDDATAEPAPVPSLSQSRSST